MVVKTKPCCILLSFQDIDHKRPKALKAKKFVDLKDILATFWQCGWKWVFYQCFIAAIALKCIVFEMLTWDSQTDWWTAASLNAPYIGARTTSWFDFTSSNGYITVVLRIKCTDFKTRVWDRQTDWWTAAVLNAPYTGPYLRWGTRRQFPHRYMTGECLQCFDAVGWAAGRASGL